MTYELNENHRLSFTVQLAYRAGRANILIDNTLNEFDAEFATNYELAYRGNFYDDRLFVSTNVYFTDWTDQQVVVDLGRALPDGRRVFGTENAGSSELRGIEITVDAQPTAALNVYASLGYSEAEFINFPRFDGRNLAGQSFANAPDFSASFGYSYAFQKGLTLAMDGNHQTSAPTTVPNNQTQLSQLRWLFNAQ